MSSIDERVVSMQFDNDQWLRRVESTNKSLDGLKKNLNLDASARSLENLSAAGNRFDLSHLGPQIENISEKFNVLGAIGFSVLQRLTNSAIDFGTNLVKKAFDPMVQGGQRRALNIEQAEFQLGGLGFTGKKLEEVMTAANYAVDGTAYGLDEAAKAAAQFAASNVPIDKMGGSLRAISGVAAMTNSSYEDMSHVFTTVAGNGRLMANELNRISARGLNAAAAIGEYLGVSEKEVREMTSKGKIDFETFAAAMDSAFGEQATKANDTYSGSLSNLRAAFARIGADYYADKFEALRRTFIGLTPVINEVRKVLQPLTKVFTTNMLSGADRFAKTLTGIADWMTELRENTKTLDLLTGAMKNVFMVINLVSGVIKYAFGEIFPPITIDSVENFARTIRNLTTRLIPTQDTLAKIQRSFKGFFAVLDIGRMMISAAINLAGRLFKVIFGGSGTVLDASASFGDFLVNLRDTIKEGEFFEKVFSKVGDILSGVVTFAKDLVATVVDLFTSLKDVSGSGFDGFLERLKTRFQPLAKMGEFLVVVWEKVAGAFQKVAEFFAPLGEKIGSALGDLGSGISEATQNLDFSTILDVFNSGVLVAIALGIRKFFKSVTGSLESGFGFADAIKDIFGGLTGSLEAMQNNLKASTLMKIAGAIALLTASVLVLSLIDSGALTKSLTAITVMFGQLMGAMAVFEKIANGAGIAKLPILALSLILVATAVAILSGAVSKLAKLNWNELAKGLTGLVVILGSLATTSQLMSGSKSAGLVKLGISLVALGFGIKILASAVSDLSGLGWDELAKGLVGVGVLLGSLALFTQIVKVNKGALTQATGLVILGAALKILASAVLDFSKMEWGGIGKGIAGISAILLAISGFSQIVGKPGQLLIAAASLTIVAASMKIFAGAVSMFAKFSWAELGKGFASIAAALLVVAGAMHLMPKNMLITAVALVVVANSLVTLAGAIQTMGGMTWEEIGKGMVVLAGSLIIIAGAMYLMTGAIPGALALFVVAGALTAIAAVIQTFGAMSWESVGVALATLAGALLLIVAAGFALTPVVGTLLLFGAALTLIGGGIALAGVGLMAFSIGLTAIGVAGAAAVTGLVAVVSGLAGLIPMVFEQIGLGVMALLDVFILNMPKIGEAVVAFVSVILDTIVELAPQLLETAVMLITTLLEAIVIVGPQIIETLVVLILSLLEAIVILIPAFVDAGLRMINGILEGIASNIEGIVTTALEIVTNFINGITNGIPDLIEAGFNMIITFIESLAQSIRDNTDRMNDAGWDLAMAIVDGMTSGIRGAVDRVVNAAKDLASSALEGAKNFLGISSPSKEFMKIGNWTGEGMSDGINKSSKGVNKASSKMADGALTTMKKAMSGIADILDSDINASPQIRPVLDLSDIKKGASSIDGLMGKPINLRGTYSNAASIVQDRRAAEEARMLDKLESKRNKATNVTFNQTNTSPKSLSTSEIYRNTNNQISRIKEAVDA